MAQHVINYLKENGFTMASFERVRQRINSDYSDASIMELIDKSPEKFCRAKLKGGKSGIALVAQRVT